MLQFGAALVVTSIPFFVNGMDSLSRNRDPLRGRNARRYARARGRETSPVLIGRMGMGPRRFEGAKGRAARPAFMPRVWHIKDTRWQSPYPTSLSESTEVTVLEILSISFLKLLRSCWRYRQRYCTTCRTA